MKTMKQLKRLLMLLCLIVAGVQSAWADWQWTNRHADVITTDPINGVTYELCHVYTRIGYIIRHSGVEMEISEFAGSTIDIETYASVVGISATGNVVIPDAITHEDKTYPVKYVGLHTEQSITTSSESYVYAGATLYETVDHYNYTQTPVEITHGNITNLTFNVDVEFLGNFNSTSLTTLNIQKKANIASTLNVPNLSNLNLEGELEISGTISSNSLTNIYFNKLFCKGKFACPSLQNVYFTNNSVSFSGQWNDCFTASKNTVTAHVYDKTDKEIAALRNTTVWCDFKEIINHKSEVSYSMAVSGNATLSFLQLKDNANYSLATNYTQQDQITSGSKTGTVKGEANYAVEIKEKDVDFDSKYVTLWRNRSVVSLNTTIKDGKTVYYYNEPNLQEDVNYQVNIIDKQCDFTLTQTGYRGNITYTKTTNGTTSSGLIWGESSTISCSRGSKLELSIPYNQYTPQSLTLNGTTIPLTLANGRATATITVPVAETAAATLVWQEPQTTYPHLQPQIMVLRAGEGDVIFKGLRYSSDTDMIEHNENAIEEGNTNGAWLNLKGDVNCSEAVTTITVPDVDDSGHWFDEGCWGFRAVMTPVKGQVLKTLLMGHITEEDGRQVISWEDMLHGNYSTDTLYFKHNAQTNTYTLSIMGDYQNFDSGDYILNIAMGPDETTIETGKTISFVRKGGRGQSYLSWYEGEQSFGVEEGSSSVLVPNGELEYDDMALVVVAEEGETFHVYKNGEDITSQFQNTWAPNYYHATLESKSATYTLHIDEAPDANPVWKVLQHEGIEGTQIVVSRTGGDDEVLVCNNTTEELTIDDSDVTKVTLNVPVSTEKGSTPLLVLKNGADVSYQFKEYADGMLTYEVPNATLYNTT